MKTERSAPQNFSLRGDMIPEVPGGRCSGGDRNIETQGIARETEPAAENARGEKRGEGSKETGDAGMLFHPDCFSAENEGYRRRNNLFSGQEGEHQSGSDVNRRGILRIRGSLQSIASGQSAPSGDSGESRWSGLILTGCPGHTYSGRMRVYSLSLRGVTPTFRF